MSSIFDFLLPAPLPYPTAAASASGSTAPTQPAPMPGFLDRIFSFLLPTPLPYPVWPPPGGVPPATPPAITVPATTPAAAPSLPLAPVPPPPITTTTPAPASAPAVPTSPAPAAPTVVPAAPVSPMAALDLPTSVIVTPAALAQAAVSSVAAADSTPPAEPPHPAPCTIVRRAFCLSPAFEPAHSRRGKSDDTEDVIHHSTPIPFLVPVGCEVVEFSVGRIERSPGECDDDGDAAVSIEGVKLVTNGPDLTALESGDQVTVSVAWRGPARLVLPEGRLRVMVYAHFRPSAG